MSIDNKEISIGHVLKRNVLMNSKTQIVMGLDNNAHHEKIQ